MKTIKTLIFTIIAMIAITLNTGCADNAVEVATSGNPFDDTTISTSESENGTATETTITTEITTTTAVKTTAEPAATTTAKAPVVNKKPVNRTSTFKHMDWTKNPKNSSISYDAASDNIFYSKGDSYFQFWRFANDGIVGVGKDRTNACHYKTSIINTENVAFTEMYAGFNAVIENGRYLKINHYYNITNAACTDIKITFMDETNPCYTVTSDKNITADLYDASYSNGFYVITATYKLGDSDVKYVANLYMFINCTSNNDSDFEAYICYGRPAYAYEKTKSPTKRQSEIQEMISAKSITPENSLNSNLSYPYEAKSQSPCQYTEDTNFWLSKADEILKDHENDSAAYKALLLHDWMTENLVYDYYKANYLENPRYYGHYDTGMYYVSQCNVGVCRDFVNIYAIMCRKYDIPCIILGNTEEGHVWNAVYLYGEWLEVDITGDITRTAMHADVTDVTPATNDNTHCYTHFCNYAYSDIMPVPSQVNSWLHLG